MIEYFIAGLVVGILVTAYGYWEIKRHLERGQQHIFKQVYTDNHGYPDIFHELEPIEREQTAPETRVLEVLSDNKDAPITYQQLADLIEPLNENDVKNAVKSLRSQGKLEVKEAGNKGSYYYVNDMEGES